MKTIYEEYKKKYTLKSFDETFFKKYETHGMFVQGEIMKNSEGFFNFENQNKFNNLVDEIGYNLNKYFEDKEKAKEAYAFEISKLSKEYKNITFGHGCEYFHNEKFGWVIKYFSEIIEDRIKRDITSKFIMALKVVECKITKYEFGGIGITGERNFNNKAEFDNFKKDLKISCGGSEYYQLLRYAENFIRFERESKHLLKDLNILPNLHNDFIKNYLLLSEKLEIKEDG